MDLICESVEEGVTHRSFARLAAQTCTWGRVGPIMVVLDTFNDNLCLWCCIAIQPGTWPEKSTQAITKLNRIYCLQKRAVRAITNSDYRANKNYFVR